MEAFCTFYDSCSIPKCVIFIFSFSLLLFVLYLPSFKHVISIKLIKLLVVVLFIYMVEIY